MSEKTFEETDETGSGENTEDQDSSGQKTEEQETEEQPKLYPLGWKDTDIKLSKGRFVHNLSRPSNDLLLRREDEINKEIPIGKDGSYGLPDESEQEDIDAKYYEEIKGEVSGYGERAVPTLHKSTAFQSLFVSEFYVDEACDIFDDEIIIIEEIGGGDDPEYTLRHVLQNPDERKMREIRKIFKNGRLAPDKRGRQKFVPQANLRKAMMHYSTYFTGIEGASLAGEKFSSEKRGQFLAEINALSQRAVLKTLVEFVTGKLSD